MLLFSYIVVSPQGLRRELIVAIPSTLAIAAATQPVKLGLIPFHSLPLISCDAPYERRLYKNTCYFAKHLYVYQVREIISLAIPCTDRVAFDELKPTFKS